MALQNLLNLKSSPDISINLDLGENRKFVEVRNENGEIEKQPIFYDGESITGTVKIHINKSQKLEHSGIRIEFIGFLEVHNDKSHKDDFIKVVRDLARPGILNQTIVYKFEFSNVKKPFETFHGLSATLSYILKLTVVKKFFNITREKELFVHSLAFYPDTDSRIQMEVGIEDSLHIEFEYNKSRYHLEDIIIGKIYFVLVRVKIKNMELQILRKESSGYSLNPCSETTLVARHEIMDGAPVRGEAIPIRIFLGQYNLSSTMFDVMNKFSIKYLLNLVLHDEENRKYYKHHEIILYRKSNHQRKSIAKQYLEENPILDQDLPKEATNSLAPDEREQKSMQRFEEPQLSKSLETRKDDEQTSNGQGQDSEDQTTPPIDEMKEVNLQEITT